MAKRLLLMIIIALFLMIITVIQFIPSTADSGKTPERSQPERSGG